MVELVPIDSKEIPARKSIGGELLRKFLASDESTVHVKLSVDEKAKEHWIVFAQSDKTHRGKGGRQDSKRQHLPATSLNTISEYFRTPHNAKN